MQMQMNISLNNNCCEEVFKRFLKIVDIILGTSICTKKKVPLNIHKCKVLYKKVQQGES